MIERNYLPKILYYRYSLLNKFLETHQVSGKGIGLVMIGLPHN